MRFIGMFFAWVFNVIFVVMSFPFLLLGFALYPITVGFMAGMELAEHIRYMASEWVKGEA